MSWLLQALERFHSMRSQARPALLAVSVARKGRAHGCVHHWHRYPAQCILSGHPTSTSSLRNLWPDPLPKSWSERACVIFPYTTHYLQRQLCRSRSPSMDSKHCSSTVGLFCESFVSSLETIPSVEAEETRFRQWSHSDFSSIAKKSALVFFSPL